MSSPWVTRLGFQPRPIPGGSAAEYVERSLRSMPARYLAVATVEAPAAETESRLQFAFAEVEPIDEHRCIVRLQGEALEWIAFALIWLGVDFTVNEPAELIEYVGRLSHRLAGAAPAQGDLADYRSEAMPTHG